MNFVILLPMKALLKFLLVIILIPVILLLVLFFVEGGTGRKEPVTLPVKDPDAPLYFAHRGVATDLPENSLPAIEKARKAGFRALEVDIRKTSDNELILFHDANAGRLLGIDTTVASLSLAEIRQRNLLWNGDTTKFKVLTLKELLDKYQDNFIYYFDMKLGGIADIDELVHLVWSYDISKNIIIGSTSVVAVLYIEYQYPAINTALEGFHPGTQNIWYLIPKNLKPDFYSGFARHVDEEHVNWMQKNDLLQQRIVYEADSTNYQKMLDFGINKMIIDHWPELQVQ